MLNVFTLANGRLFQEEIESHGALADLRPVWVDLEAPTEEEKGWVTERSTRKTTASCTSAPTS